MYVLICIYPTPPHGQDVAQGQFFSGVQQVWIQSFPCPMSVAMRAQSELLFICRWRKNNWIYTFPKGISAMCNIISLIQDLNCVTVSISYDDNHYSTGASVHLQISVCVCVFSLCNYCKEDLAEKCISILEEEKKKRKERYNEIKYNHLLYFVYSQWISCSLFAKQVVYPFADCNDSLLFHSCFFPQTFHKERCVLSFLGIFLSYLQRLPCSRPEYHITGWT